MTVKFEVPFAELEIDKNEAFRYAGIKGEADESLNCLYEKAYELLAESLKPKAVYKFYDCTYFEDGVIIGDEKIHSQGLRTFLKESKGCALMAATAGISADRLINRYSLCEPSLALMLDALAAATVEALCNKMCKEIFKVSCHRRFSPGYGDFPIAYQRFIIDELDATLNIGVTLTESLMSAPSKSVTAVIPKDV